jgi:CBS domain-containing protein
LLKQGHEADECETEGEMRVQEVMSTPARSCQPDTDLAAVAHVMWEGDLPVVGPTGQMIGVITDRDICVASATRGLSPERISAAQAMSQTVRAVLPSDNLDRALEAMRQSQVRRLPVIDDDGRLKGVVSLNDVVRAVGRKGGPTAGAAVAVMAAICAPRKVAAA